MNIFKSAREKEHLNEIISARDLTGICDLVERAANEPGSALHNLMVGGDYRRILTLFSKIAGNDPQSQKYFQSIFALRESFLQATAGGQGVSPRKTDGAREILLASSLVISMLVASKASDLSCSRQFIDTVAVAMNPIDHSNHPEVNSFFTSGLLRDLHFPPTNSLAEDEKARGALDRMATAILYAQVVISTRAGFGEAGFYSAINSYLYGLYKSDSALFYHIAISPDYDLNHTLYGFASYLEKKTGHDVKQEQLDEIILLRTIETQLVEMERDGAFDDSQKLQEKTKSTLEGFVI